MTPVKVHLAPQLAPRVFEAELTNWIEAGIAPDSRLLRAIIDNDLGQAVALIGSASAWALVHDTLFWLWKLAPPQCYGSKIAVLRWEQMGGKGGLQ